MKGITNQTIELITDAIRLEFVKRGFHASIWIERSTNLAGRERLEVLSEPFQTTPVIFKSITIHGYSYGIREDEGKLPAFVISIGVSYKHFNGGSNGCDLFTFQCFLCKDGGISYPQTF